MAFSSVRKTAHRCVFVIPPSRGISEWARSHPMLLRDQQTAPLPYSIPPFTPSRAMQQRRCRLDLAPRMIHALFEQCTPMASSNDASSRCCLTQNFLSYAYIASFSFRTSFPSVQHSFSWVFHCLSAMSVFEPPLTTSDLLGFCIKSFARVYIRELSSHSSRRSGPVPAQIMH